ncbi:MAG: PEP-CTERM sorting domain-containing protein [Verrucomicrobia bacterium]|nr:PEP-CTERM sorting domain-containing protein [Verrucomicrobiota bacterium]
MKSSLLIATLAAGLSGFAWSAVTTTDTFGNDAFAIEFVTIGNPGNSRDTGGAGYGAVGCAYRIGKYETSRGMIDIYNSLGGGPVITLGSLSSYGGNGTNRPATGLTWNEMARFVNWLNTSRGYAPAYKFTTNGANDMISLWTSADGPAYDAQNAVRNPNAYYFIPTADEWYKAAFYDPSMNGGTGGYWRYATGCDTLPTRIRTGTDPGTAVYNDFAGGPADITSAGGLSPYGTMAQSGNVEEWTESRFGTGGFVNCLVLNTGWGGDGGAINSSRTAGYYPGYDGLFRGFRVAAVPEPTTLSLCGLGILAMWRRKRTV